MISIIKHILILSNNTKKTISYSAFFIALTMLDLIGFGLIGSFFSLLTDGEQSSNSAIIKGLNLFVGESSLVKTGLILILIYLFKDIITFSLNRSILLFANFSAHDLRLKLINNYQSQSFKDYIDSNSSKYIQSVTEYCYMYNVCLVGVLRIFSDIFLLFAVSIFFLFYFGSNVLYAFLFLLIAIFIYDRVFKNKIQLYGKNANLSNKEYIKNVNELIRGFREIRIYSKEEHFNETFSNSSYAYGLNRAKSQIISTIPRYLIEFSAISSMIILAIILQNNSEINPSSTLASLSIIAVATFRIIPSFITLATNISQIRSNKHTFETLIEYVSLGEKRLKQNLISENTNNEFKTLKLKDISFSYDDNKIFEKVSFQISLGEKVLIKGPSGSGKTTLINLITGLLSPESGQVLIDSVPLNNNFLQSLTAYIPQQTFILDDSIIKNVAFGLNEKDIDLRKVNDSLVQANLKKYVDSLEYGLDTIVGEDGSLISGGQKQRLVLARAFYFDKKIIIMDESTNSLDKQSEKIILKELHKNSKNKIIIFVSHQDHTEISFNKKLLIESKSVKQTEL